jgi:hypothetical protein
MTNDDNGTDKDNYDDDHDYDHDQDHTNTTYNPSNCSNSCCCSLPAAVWCGPAVPPLRGPAKGYSKGSTRPRWLQELKSMIRFMAGGRSGRGVCLAVSWGWLSRHLWLVFTWGRASASQVLSFVCRSALAWPPFSGACGTGQRAGKKNTNYIKINLFINRKHLFTTEPT